MRFDDGAEPDAPGSEDLAPEYKISFWNGPHHEEWVTITEADADEVLEWAASNADGRHYSIWARTVERQLDGQVSTHDVRLIGTDPPARDESFPIWARRPAW